MLPHFANWERVGLRVDRSEDYEHIRKFSADAMPQRT
jgi:hypothetical protein